MLRSGVPVVPVLRPWHLQARQAALAEDQLQVFDRVSAVGLGLDEVKKVSSHEAKRRPPPWAADRLQTGGGPQRAQRRRSARDEHTARSALPKLEAMSTDCVDLTVDSGDEYEEQKPPQLKRLKQAPTWREQRWEDGDIEDGDIEILEPAAQRQQEQQRLDKAAAEPEDEDGVAILDARGEGELPGSVCDALTCAARLPRGAGRPRVVNRPAAARRPCPRSVEPRPAAFARPVRRQPLRLGSQHLQRGPLRQGVRQHPPPARSSPGGRPPVAFHGHHTLTHASCTCTSCFSSSCFSAPAAVLLLCMR